MDNIPLQKIPNINNEDALKSDYSIDENTYQNLWGQYQSYIVKNYKMIVDEVENFLLLSLDEAMHDKIESIRRDLYN